ncbi:MAG: SRPBCC domain-containing protein [Ramlibacter sp.]
MSTVTDDTDRALIARRRLAATPAQVFDAFREPQRLARWWGPAGFRNHFAVFEFRPGGRWRHEMEGPDGQCYPNEALFEALEPGSRVVVRHVSAPGFTLTVTLTPAGGGTDLEWRQVFDTAALRAQLQAVCEPANEQNLDRLQAELAAAS